MLSKCPYHSYSISCSDHFRSPPPHYLSSNQHHMWYCSLFFHRYCNSAAKKAISIPRHTELSQLVVASFLWLGWQDNTLFSKFLYMHTAQNHKILLLLPLGAAVRLLLQFLALLLSPTVVATTSWTHFPWASCWWRLQAAFSWLARQGSYHRGSIQ